MGGPLQQVSAHKITVTDERTINLWPGACELSTCTRGIRVQLTSGSSSPAQMLHPSRCPVKALVADAAALPFAAHTVCTPRPRLRAPRRPRCRRYEPERGMRCRSCVHTAPPGTQRTRDPHSRRAAFGEPRSNALLRHGMPPAASRCRCAVEAGSWSLLRRRGRPGSPRAERIGSSNANAS